MKIRPIVTASLITLIISCYSLSDSSVATLGHQKDHDIKRKALIILEHKCNSCHRSQNPGKVFTIDNMDAHAAKIHRQVFVKRRMPRGDVRLMPEEERMLLSWLKEQLPERK